jgi:phosphoglycolate phosphatase
MDNRMKKISFPRAVIFDWDNTLIDAWGAVVDSVNAVRGEFGQEPLTRAAVIENSSRSARNLFRDWYGDKWPRAHEIFYGRYQKAHLAHVRALPCVPELLRWFESRDVPSFVVSNKRGDILRQEAEHLGWTGTFKAMVGSMDAPRDKPDRAPVDLALGYAGLKADDPLIWFVGDTHADVECARNAGCTPVLVHNPDEAMRMGVDLSFSGCQGLLEMLYSLERT